MKLLSHRGNLEGPNSAQQPNSIKALDLACSMGFGIETDLRQLNSSLVISHDFPSSSSESAVKLNQLAEKYPTVSFALNIKEDGLGPILVRDLSHKLLEKSFFFDFSIPDLVASSNLGLNIFSRLSEYESTIEIAGNKGVWLDQFHSLWFSNDAIFELLDKGYEVVLVSSELHRRNHLELWEMIKPFVNNDRISLCTDYPLEAAKYLNLSY